jgi:hypothetical protein
MGTGLRPVPCTRGAVDKVKGMPLATTECPLAGHLDFLVDSSGYW